MEKETNNPQAALRATVDPLLTDYLRRRRAQPNKVYQIFRPIVPVIPHLT